MSNQTKPRKELREQTEALQKGREEQREAIKQKVDRINNDLALCLLERFVDTLLPRRAKR